MERKLIEMYPINEEVKTAFERFCKYGKITNPEIVSQYLVEKGGDFGLSYEMLDKCAKPEDPNIMELFKNTGNLLLLSDETLNRLLFEIKIRTDLPKHEVTERYYNKEISFYNSQLFKNACGLLRNEILNTLFSRINRDYSNIDSYYAALANRDANEYFTEQEFMLDEEIRKLK